MTNLYSLPRIFTCIEIQPRRNGMDKWKLGVSVFRTDPDIAHPTLARDLTGQACLRRQGECFSRGFTESLQANPLRLSVTLITTYLCHFEARITRRAVFASLEKLGHLNTS